MSKVTEEQIEAWKVEHPQCKVFSLDGHSCYFRPPSFSTLKAAFSKSYEVEQCETLAKNCFLGGDEILIKEDAYLLASGQAVLEMLKEFPDYELSRSSNGIYTVVLEGLTCRLTRPSRQNLIESESRNRRKTPFMSNRYLLDMIWVDGDEALRTDEMYLIGLLSAVDEIKNGKVGSLKNA